MSVLASLICSVASAKWSSIEEAPLHIKRHDRTIVVETDGTWNLKGTIEIKVNTTAGRALISAYKFPVGDELEELKIISAEVLEPTQTRAVPPNQIVVRDSEPTEGGRLFLSKRATTIAFGDVAIGTSTRITYEISLKKPRIPSLFSMTFKWGQQFPELAGSVTFESKAPLFLDISRAARKTISFSKGRLPTGSFVWKAELKAPIFVKPEGEAGGILSTNFVPRLQISNKNSWASVLNVLTPKYAALASEPMPLAFQKIIDAAKTMPNPNERLNRVIEMVNQAMTFQPEWSRTENGFLPAKLSLLAQVRNGDAKDFAFVTSLILRTLGYTADVTLVWKQAPTERLWIDEKLTTPSLSLFNHAIVRILDQGKVRYFDPTSSVPFAEGFLSDIGGSWALTVTKAPRAFERLPSEAPIPSLIKLVQSLDLRPDASIVGSGKIVVEGPLAAELKQLYLSQGAAQVEPYLRSLFGLAFKSENVTPIIRVNTQNRRGRTFELSFSYLAPMMIQTRGLFREFNLPTPGLAGVPRLANATRVTDVILSRGLTFEIETKVIGGEIADETNTSCLSLTSFASLLRETKALNGSFSISEHIQFKSDRISARHMGKPEFLGELRSYSSCLARNHAAVGPRPAFEKSPLGLSAEEISVLKKPVANVNLQDITLLDDIQIPLLRPLIGTKIWLAAREMLRRNLRSPAVILEYANALMETGRVATEQGDIVIPEHINEAAKLFGAVAVQDGKTAKFHRVHASMLIAANRPNEALIALRNAIAIEPAQAKDSALVGQIYVGLGNDAKAEAWLRQATISRGSKSMRIRAFEALAKIRLRQRKIPEFIAFYNQAIAEAPTNAWLYHDFAKQLQGIKMWELSMEQSRKALTIMRFPEAEATLAQTLIRQAENLYFTAPGVPTADPKVLEAAERLALECLKYTRTEVLPYRIAGHVTFLKALAGDYSSLIATQSYYAKAIELGANDSWLQDRYKMANESLETSRPIAQIWAAYLAAAKSRTPAAGPPGPAVPKKPTGSSMRFPVQ